MSVGKQIKKAREELGITQRELGSKLGITSSAIANYENDISRPREEIFVELLSVLGVDANYIYSDSLLKNLCGPDLSPDSLQIEKYRALDSHGKKLVDTVLELEYSRIYPPDISEPGD